MCLYSGKCPLNYIETKFLQFCFKNKHNFSHQSSLVKFNNMEDTHLDAFSLRPMSTLEIEGRKNKWNPSQLNLIISLDRSEEPDFLLFLLNRLFMTVYQDNLLPLPHLPMYYLRGVATYRYNAKIDSKNISNLPLDLQLIIRAISRNIKNNIGGSVAYETQMYENENGVLRFPFGNPWFSYSILNKDEDILGINYPKPVLHLLCKKNMQPISLVGFGNKVYTKQKYYLVLDNFSQIDCPEYLSNIKNVVDKLNHMGISVILIIRNNMLLNKINWIKNFCEIKSFCDNKVPSRIVKKYIFIHLVNQYLPKEEIFFKDKIKSICTPDCEWIKYYRKNDFLKSQIQELFEAGFTAKEMQNKLDSSGIKLSLATLSKLMLRWGFRRNKFHKRKKRKKA